MCAKELLYADDSAFVAHSENELQEMLTDFNAAANSPGLSINVRKTEVMLQHAPNIPIPDPVVLLNNEPLKVVQNFTYLGSTISNDNSLEKEVEKRICSAATAFGKLQTKVWKRPGIRLSTKCKVYRAVVLSCLLYSSETYILYRRHIQRLQKVQMSHLRQLMKISWRDKVSNVEIRKRANLPSVEAILTENQLRWTGHVIRMDERRLPKAVLYGELQLGRRGVGRPKLRFKDCIKRHLNTNRQDWEQQAKKRPLWKSIVSQTASAVDLRLEAESAARSQRRANRSNLSNPQAPNPDLQCRHCGRLCRARIGLLSHEKACQRHTPTE